eukprot:TRINITY_DN7936_c0_g4_i1.p1 TRINITY_DN7936_c0_g4~~TRINITY_DN7936_c0_g4_i1.p1  ORF type:complete len:1476 (+),score=153.04 TRINITY_DN7936_c0_g4_i1:165-4592(+)
MFPSCQARLLGVHSGEVDDNLDEHADDEEIEREEDNSDDESLDEACASPLLGTSEDKHGLAQVVRRFQHDDLASIDDEVVAAVRMQVHVVSNFSRILHIIGTCGLWLCFQPREDQGSLLLTKKGRVIAYGKGQAALPGLVFSYLVKVILLALSLLCATGLLWYWLVNLGIHVHLRLVAFLITLIVLVIFVCYAWAQRPRRDCGSSFRQHFEIGELCVSTYVRADQGRPLLLGCPRRRVGHLRLCFTKRYPSESELNARLPFGSPDMAGVSPTTIVPPAMAGERAHVEEDEVKNAGGEASRILVKIAALLALLSAMGAAYDYLSLVDKSRVQDGVCMTKKADCSLRVDNSLASGKVTRPDGTLPPADYKAAHCNEYGDYCDYTLKPPDYCVDREDHAEGGTRVRVDCQHLEGLFHSMQRRSVVNYDGTVKDYYVNTEERIVWSIPTNHPWSMTAQKVRILVEKGMHVTSIGPAGSLDNQLLSSGEAIWAESLLSRCETVYHGSVEITYVEQPKMSPMFPEDCEDLQQACMAYGLGPETSAYWPPYRFIDHTYTPTICLHYPIKLPWGQKKWYVLEQSRSNGLTCAASPVERLQFAEEQLSVSERIQKCQRACEHENWCTHVYYAGHMMRAFEIRQDTKGERASTIAKLEGATLDVNESSFQCLLYETCNADAQNRSELQSVICGEPCEEDSCADVIRAFKLQQVDSVEACHSACVSATQALAQCNAYAFDVDDNRSCTIYGPLQLEKPSVEWLKTTANLAGEVGRLGGTKCFSRQGISNKRERSGSPGLLLRYTDVTRCGGCVEKTLFEFFTTPSSACMFVGHVLTLVGLLIVANSARKMARVGQASFSGTPVIHMCIVQDPANQDNFDVRERAYVTFLARCSQVGKQLRDLDSRINEEVMRGRSPQARRNDGSTIECDCWDADAAEHRSEDVQVLPVDKRRYEIYNLSNLTRTKCYVDKKLLGLSPDEKVCCAWSDTHKLGIYVPLATASWYFITLFLISFFVPDEVEELLPSLWINIVFWVLIPAIGAMHYYIKAWHQTQTVCVITTHGRLVQLVRTLPATFFPATMCPAWYGGTSIRLDSYQIGGIASAQLDMPKEPLFVDRLRSGFTRSWRRGVVTIRGHFGLLQVHRLEGEAMEVYRGLNALALGAENQVDGLRPVGVGGACVHGVCPTHDLMTLGEAHVFERKMEAFGFFGDPFNYTTLLSLTDRRIIVTRARQPKRPSLLGFLIGPWTCGSKCAFLQEYLGRHAYVTVSSVWYGGLASYATSRVRAPPFWPGCMRPVMSVSLLFLEHWNMSYPSGLRVTQRPYGIERKVHINNEGEVLLSSGPSSEQQPTLLIVKSSLPSAPRGHRVVSVSAASGQPLDIDDDRWSAPGGVALEAGSCFMLEAGDAEWDTYADEPWLFQVRSILDHVLGRSEAAAWAWEELEEPETIASKPKGAWQRAAARVVGSHMLGHHEDRSSSDGSEGDTSTDSQ